MFSMRNGSCSRSSLNRYNAWSISEEDIPKNIVSIKTLNMEVFLSPRMHLVCCGKPRRSAKWCRCSWQTQLPLDSDISGVPLWSSEVPCTCVPWRNPLPNSPAETKTWAEKDRGPSDENLSPLVCMMGLIKTYHFNVGDEVAQLQPWSPVQREDVCCGYEDLHRLL